MNDRAAGWLLALAGSIIFTSGCQTGRLNMPSLAFWKNNDTLSADYIEPPSHQFEPGSAAVAKSAADKTTGASSIDSGDGPPVKPQTAERNAETMESFAADVNRSWEQLAEQTRANAERHSEELNQAMVDMANATRSPVASTPPDSTAAAPPTRPAGAYASSAPPSSNASGNDFAPNPALAQAKPSGGQTAYERLASQTLSPLTPVSPSSVPANPAPQATAQNSAATMTSDAASSPLATAPVRPSYDSTPYPAFQPRDPLDEQTIATSPAVPAGPTTTAPPATATSSTGSIPSTLALSGQATYAPGSIRRPEPSTLAPSTVPHTAAGGGDFRR